MWIADVRWEWNRSIKLVYGRECKQRIAYVVWNKVDSRFLTRSEERDEDEDVKNRCSHEEYFFSRIGWENLSHTRAANSV